MIAYLLIGLAYAATVITMSWRDLKTIWDDDRGNTALKVFYFMCVPVGVTVLWPFFLIWGVVESIQGDKE